MQSCNVYSIEHTVHAQVVQGNLVKRDVYAIVNAANQHLRHSGGVARAIAQAAGPVLVADCAQLLSGVARFPSGCVPVVFAVRTGAGVMLCRAIIHAVAPKYAGKNRHRFIVPHRVFCVACWRHDAWAFMGVSNKQCLLSAKEAGETYWLTHQPSIESAVWCRRSQ